jgi:hypothetical protein
MRVGNGVLLSTTSLPFSLERREEKWITSSYLVLNLQVNFLIRVLPWFWQHSKGILKGTLVVLLSLNGVTITLCDFFLHISWYLPNSGTSMVLVTIVKGFFLYPSLYHTKDWTGEVLKNWTGLASFYRLTIRRSLSKSR